MKILQIVNPVIPFPPTTVGGTERIVQYLIDELVKAGHEVTLMAHNDSIVPPGVKFIPIGTYTDRKKTLQKIWKQLLFHKYDVIHNHGRLLHFLPAVWSKTRKIHTFHMADLESRAFHNFLNLRSRNFTFSPCAKWIQERYKHLKGNWQYVHNGLPLALYKFDPGKNTADAPLVMITRIGRSKGVLDAVEIAEKTGRKLIIAGKVGDYRHEIEWFEENLLPRCDGEKIRFIGPVNDVRKNDLLNNAAALLIPTIDSEAFNTTMIEANACGCPVISYDKFCFTEFIEDGKNGFKGKDINALIELIPKLRDIKRNDCRQQFEQYYTSAIMAEKYLQLYHQTV